MSGFLIVITGFIYLYIGAEQAYKDNVAMAVVYLGYACANVGMYLAVDK
jgi:hypothetical protein